MIDPKEIVSSSEDDKDDDLKIMHGSFGCPEQGCYEITRSGKFDSQSRTISWTCANNHKGTATI